MVTTTQIEPKIPYDIPNPKDALASQKVPLALVPDSLKVLASLSSLEGALKYGKYNYRARPVRVSVYLEAMERHMIRMNNGEWTDKKTKVPHICSIIKCAAIIGDAWLNGSLVDDRPPFNKGLLVFMDEVPEVMVHLKKIFSKSNPVQYTEKAMQEVLRRGKARRRKRGRKAKVRRS